MFLAVPASTKQEDTSDVMPEPVVISRVSLAAFSAVKAVMYRSPAAWAAETVTEPSAFLAILRSVPSTFTASLLTGMMFWPLKLLRIFRD